VSAATTRRLRRRAPVAAALATTAAFGAVGGPRGAALGAAVGLVAAVVPTPVGFVLGHLCLGVLPVALGGARLVLLEAGLVALLLPALLDPLGGGERLVAVVGLAVVVAALAALALWLVPPVGTPWASVAALAAVTAAAGGAPWLRDGPAGGSTPQGGSGGE
jgi:hypothetical protein